jgi:hypothetical protein
MRDPRRFRGVLIAAIAGVVALTPVLALGAGAVGMPFAGTYDGMASGKADAGGGSRAITVYVGQEGSQARITFHVAGFPSVDAYGTPAYSGEEAVVPFSVNDWVSGSGELLFVREGGKWVLTGNGKGSALSYTGTGELAAFLTSSEDAAPSVGAQINGTIENLFGGGKESTKTVPPPAVKPAGPLAPAERTGPVSGSAATLAYFLAVLMLIIDILLA